MKAIVTCIIMAFMVCSCASVRMTGKDGSSISYFRIGDQQLDDVGFLKDPTTGEIEFIMKGQKSTGKALTDAIGLIGTLAEMAKTATPVP